MLFGTLRGFPAQWVQGAISGIIKSTTGDAISGAKITLTNEASHSARSVRASKTGEYVFTAVEAGKYTLRAVSRGFKPAMRAHIAVDHGQRVAVDFTVEPFRSSSTRTHGTASDASSLTARAGYYDDTHLKSSTVKGAVDAGGYSSPGQARTSSRLLQGVASLKREAPAGSAGSAAAPDAMSPKALATIEGRLKKELKAAPESFEANHNLGEFYLHVGNLPAGIPYLEKAEQLDTSHYNNGYDLALAYLETNSLVKARGQIQQMIGRQDMAELHDLLGEVEERAGHYVTAVNEYERAAHMEPSEENIFDWGSELLMHQTFDPAIEVFTSGVERYPHSAMLQIGLGVALYSRGRYEEAIKALCLASDLTPTDPRPYLFLGRMYSVTAVNADQVSARLERFIKVQPQNALAHYYYAMSLWKGQRGQSGQVNFEQIESLLKRSMTLDPKYPDAYLQLGILYSEQKKYPEAIGEYRRAIALQPGLVDAHYRLAQAYTRTGEHDKARAEFEIHDRLRKQELAETDKRRAEIKQFVYSMKDNPNP
ncbi:MAG: tetratricopeptide repeat protein [Terriglobia bacterium]